MINFDSIIQPTNQSPYKNISPLYPQHPFRSIIVACSGAGKTNDLLNIIHNSVFHKIYVYSKTLDEDKYQFLINVQKQKEQLLKQQGISENLIHFSTDITNAIPLENLDKNYQHLYVFDDICLESSKEQELLALRQQLEIVQNSPRDLTEIEKKASELATFLE